MALQVENYDPALKAGAVINAANDIALTNTYLLVGSSSGVAVGVAMSGDTSIDNTGAVTVDRLTGLEATELTASGAIAATASFVELNSTTPLIAATIAAPSAGRLLVITQTDAGTAGHTVTLTAGTYDGTNTVATFNAAAETLVLMGVSSTRFVIVENIGSVALS